MSNSTIQDALQRFQSRTIVSSHLLDAKIFEAELKVIIDEFIRSTTTGFAFLFNASRFLSQADQYLLADERDSALALHNSTDSANDGYGHFQVVII